MNLPGVYDFWLEQWKDFQTCWMISDLHFNDEDLRKGHPTRISNDDLVRAINSKVGKRDILFILGDVGDINYLRKLRGYKILIIGNHDAGAENYKRQTYSRYFDKDKYTKQEALNEMKHQYPDCIYDISYGYDFHSSFEYWLVNADNNLCDMVIPGPLMLGEKLILSHEPIPNLSWALNLHGHQHNGSVKQGLYHYNVCVDVMGPTPLNLNQFLKGGPTAHIQPLHRQNIDNAIQRKAKRGGKKIWEVRK